MTASRVFGSGSGGGSIRRNRLSLLTCATAQHRGFQGVGEELGVDVAEKGQVPARAQQQSISPGLLAPTVYSSTSKAQEAAPPDTSARPRGGGAKGMAPNGVPLGEAGAEADHRNATPGEKPDKHVPQKVEELDLRQAVVP